MPTRRSAREVIDLVVDSGSWQSWDGPVNQGVVTDGYAAELAAAAARSGSDEAVVTGEGTVRGRRIAIRAGEFAFLAGSVGRAAGERLTVAIERATAERLPPGTSSSARGNRRGQGSGGCCGMGRPTSYGCRARERESTTPASYWPWRASAERPACSSGRTGAGRAPRTRWARRHWPPHVAGSGSRASWDCRWSRSSTPAAPR